MYDSENSWLEHNVWAKLMSVPGKIDYFTCVYMKVMKAFVWTLWWINLFWLLKQMWKTRYDRKTEDKTSSLNYKWILTTKSSL